MKIAILYICIGKYIIFWDEFYKSSQKNFLTEHEKTYFVFTDNIEFNESDHIHKVFQEDLGWPKNTLFRYNMFEKIEDQLKDYDYIFFFNSNSVFVSQIGNEILPIKEGLVVTQHPGYYNKKRVKFTYEKNKNSSAYINDKQGDYYVCGGVNGGKAENFIKLIKNLSINIQNDYKNGIIAVWHDESHLNKYILNKKYKLLDSGYAYPEGWTLPFEKKIIILDKNNYGGHDFLRADKKNIFLRAKIRIKKAINRLFK